MAAPSRILFFIESHQHGGTDRYFFDLCNQLAKEGHGVEVLHNGGSNFIARSHTELDARARLRPVFFLSADGMTHSVQKTGWPEPLKLAARALLFPMRYLFYPINTLLFFFRLSGPKPDVFHIINGGYPGAMSCHAAALAGRLRSFPRILFSVLNAPFGRKVPAVDWALDKLTSGSVDLFIPNARALGSELASLRGVPSAKIRPIYTCAKPPATRLDAAQQAAFRARHGLSKDDYVICYLAMFELVKGHAGLLASFASLRQSLPDAKLALGASGKAERALRAQAKALNLGASVLFPGSGQVNEWHSCADLVVYPSTREGLPYALEEAMHFAKPIITSDAGGISELIEDGKSGIILPAGDANAWAGAMKQMHDDKALASRLGAAAQARVREKFSLAAMAEETKQAYGI
ncbi:MAG: glycosyltransferase family 4 protein [Candidatus Marsarchaeota archaeon]|nr:glycosyltransferase family 4 protein [Candidatus Marsarchaeota archaeon]